jgi:capsular polysaccharide biosynthesis protein
MIEEFDRPHPVSERPTTLLTIRRYWYLVLICAVLGAACGAVYAFKRPPVYTATARMSAVAVNASNAASLAGSLEAAQGLAGTFARVVQSTTVVNPVANALHTTPAWVAAHVSGTPVPTSPFVSISANASTAGVAKTAANTALTALSGYAHHLLNTQSSSKSLLGTVHQYAVALSRAEDQVTRLKAQAQRQEANQALTTTTAGPATPDPAIQRQIDEATAKVTETETQLSGAQALYTQLTENNTTSRQAVSLAPASSATNDRKRVAQIAILFGLLVGAVIGVAGVMALGARASRPA